MKKLSLLLVIFVFVLTACGSEKTKESNNLENFMSVAGGYGYAVSDNLNGYKNVNYITGASMATFGDTELEMIIYDSEENAITVQNSQIDNFLKLKSTGESIHKDKGDNYYKYVMISNGYYMVSSRIDNTLIFTKTPLENKESVENVLNAMGY